MIYAMSIAELKSIVVTTDVQLQNPEHDVCTNLIADFLLKNELVLGDSQEKIIEAAAEMLVHHEIKTEFLNNKENLLLLLALAEEWLNCKSLRERISVLQLLKVLAIRNTPNGNETTSLRVKRLSELKYKRIGEDYDPQSAVSEKINAEVFAIYKEMMAHIDGDLTFEAHEWLSTEKSKFKLSSFKKELGITADDKPFKIVVIKKTVREMMQIWGSSGVIFTGVDLEPVLVVGNDHGEFDKNIVEHEWNHSQGEWLSGYRNLLFKGFNEAITESLTRLPNSYADERTIFEEILKRIPGIKADIIKGYLGDHQAREDADLQIVKTYGLKGLLLLARMLFVKSAAVYTPRKIQLGIEVAKHFDPEAGVGLDRKLEFIALTDSLKYSETSNPLRRRTSRIVWG